MIVGTNVFAVFRGYLWWNERLGRWDEDEWLTQIYGQLKDAREAIELFAEGKPYDNNREIQVTRYFGKRTDPYRPGEELEKDDPNVMEHIWMRFARFEVR